MALTPCRQLYDPCTREPIQDIKLLKARCREIEHDRTATGSDFPEFPDSIKTRLDLLVDLIQRDEPPGYHIFQYKKGENKNYGTSLFEAYWDIALALGCIEEYRLSAPDRYMVNSKVEELRGVLNFSDKSKFIPAKSILHGYLEKRKVMATQEQGASDITIAYKQEYIDPPEEWCLYSESEPKVAEAKPLFYLFSSKFFKSEKSTSRYDVERIYLAAKHLKDDLKANIKIPILANDKASLDGFIERALSRFVAEEIHETYGATELLAALNTLYMRIKTRYPAPRDRTVAAIASVFGLAEREQLDFFSPRFHQIIAIDKICDAVEEQGRAGFTADNNKFLVGVLPRGGKTYIAGGIVERLQPKIVLVILGAKSETIKQFTQDLFNKFQNFSNYTVINLLDRSQDLAEGRSYIIISSIELLVKESTSQGRKIMEKILSNQRGYRADLILYDEAHLKGTKGRGRAALGVMAKKGRQQQADTDDDDAEEAEKEEEVISQLSNCPIIFFTGTYRKPRDRFRIPENKMIVWDYEDIQRGKGIATEMEYFMSRFGQYTTAALEKLRLQGTTVEMIEQQYRKFPELYLLTANFNDEAKKELSPEVLDFPNLFAITTPYDFKNTDHNDWHNALKHKAKLEDLLGYFAPKKGGRYRSVIDRIDELAQMSTDRLRGIASSPSPGRQMTHSQIWFMPRTMGLGTLPNRMMAFASLILKQTWFAANFDIVCVYTKGAGEHPKPQPLEFGEATVIFQPFMCKGKKTLKDCLVEYETESRARGRCLIIIAQDKLKLGISLPCVDIVVLLDDNKDVDERIQKMYRALTESDGKKAGFVVDMNYFRCVNAVIEYKLTENKKRRQDLSDREKTELVQTVFRDLFVFDPDRYLGIAVEKGAKMAEQQIMDEMKGLIGAAAEYSEARDREGLENIGKKLNSEVEEIVDDITFDGDLLLSLKLTKQQREKEMKRQIRGPPKHVQRAKAHELGPAPEPGPESGEEPESDKIQRAKQDIYKTILKFGAITGNVPDLSRFLEKLQTPEYRQIRLYMYEVLDKRELLEDEPDMDKQSELIEKFAALLAEKITDDSRDYFKSMKDKMNSFDTTESFTGILDYITAHLAPKDAERHKYGEVFTPLTLVDEMLSKLPADGKESVWTNKDLKWLDPANGIGNFPIKAFVGQKEGPHRYPGLYEGLKKAIPDDKARCKYIIEEMLYMIDINNKNNLIAKKLFHRLCPDATANIEQIHKDHGFLVDEPLVFNKKVVKEFDIIMGNPPYQGGAVKSVGTNATRKMRKETGLTTDLNKNLWIPFTTKSIRILRKGGYLLFIHPIGWFKPDGLKAQVEIHNLILSKQILTMKIYDQGQSLKRFGDAGKIAVSYYVLENSDVYEPTTIVNTLGGKEEVLLSSKSIISRAYTNILSKIMAKCPLWKDTADYKQKGLNKQDCVFGGAYKNIQKIGNDGLIYIINSSKELDTLKYPKIYIDGYHYPRYFYDKDGSYGIIDQNQHYLIGENLGKQELYFKTKLSALILKYVKYRQEFIEPRYYPDVRTLPLKKITDETLADYFGFTKEERAAIDATEYPKREYKFKEITCAQLKGEKAEKSEATDSDTEGGGRQRRFTRKAKQVQ